MSAYALVLSDELLSVYFDFRQGKIANSRLLESFLSYYHAPFLTNVEQLKRIGINSEHELIPQLAAQGFMGESLEELAGKTYYKIILNTSSSEYPYVNINCDKVEKNFSLTFKVGEDREKAIQLIKALCDDAKFILIFDPYFCNNWRNTKNVFHQIIPKKKLTLLDSGHLGTKTSEIKKIYPEWIIKSDKKNTYTRSHDRYLLIDNEIEVILSSGFDYLFSTHKDLTCVIRSVNAVKKSG